MAWGMIVTQSDLRRRSRCPGSMRGASGMQGCGVFWRRAKVAGLFQGSATHRNCERQRLYGELYRLGAHHRAWCNAGCPAAGAAAADGAGGGLASPAPRLGREGGSPAVRTVCDRGQVRQLTHCLRPCPWLLVPSGSSSYSCVGSRLCEPARCEMALSPPWPLHFSLLRQTPSWVAVVPTAQGSTKSPKSQPCKPHAQSCKLKQAMQLLASQAGGSAVQPGGRLLFSSLWSLLTHSLSTVTQAQVAHAAVSGAGWRRCCTA